MSPPSSFRACASHGYVKANWRTMTDDWRAWDSICPGALLVRCKTCQSHIIILAPAGESAPIASSPNQSRVPAPVGAVSAPGPDAAQEHGGPNSYRSERAASGVFDDPDPTISMPCLKDFN